MTSHQATYRRIVLYLTLFAVGDAWHQGAPRHSRRKCLRAETGMAKCLDHPDTFQSCTLLRSAPIVLRHVQHPPVCCGTPNPTRNRTNGYGSRPLLPPNASVGHAVTAVVKASRLRHQNADASAKSATTM